MVEKWLLQVEKQMIKSLRDTIEKAISGYYATELTSWVLDWPGQVGSENILRHNAIRMENEDMKNICGCFILMRVFRPLYAAGQ